MLLTGQSFSSQSIRDDSIAGEVSHEVTLVDHSRVHSLYTDMVEEADIKMEESMKRKCKLTNIQRISAQASR